MRIYSVIFDQVSVSAAQDAFSMKASATVPLVFLGVTLAESNKSGDANDAQLRWRIRRGQTTQGSGGSTPTPQPVDSPTDTASVVTCHVNDTTQASAGTIVTLHNDIFNIRAGLIWLPPEKLQFKIAPATCMTIEFPAAPAAALTMNGTLYFGELI